jgi:predicted RNA-binding Zn ribbon-like protein
MVETAIQSAPVFDQTSGNWLCLDFTHTLEDRPSGHPRELLNSYSDFVSWGLYMHLLTGDEAQHLLEEAARHPAQASQALQKAIVSREVIYRIFYQIAEDSSPTGTDLTTLNTILSETMSHAHIVQGADGFIWDWDSNQDILERLLWPVVRSAADLLTSDELHVVRVCAAEDCGWLFLDTSKNHSRRWCDMKSCGNRAKARRHYGRKKGSSSDIERVTLPHP